jgi:hypothetical protein
MSGLIYLKDVTVAKGKNGFWKYIKAKTKDGKKTVILATVDQDGSHKLNVERVDENEIQVGTFYQFETGAETYKKGEVVLIDESTIVEAENLVSGDIILSISGDAYPDTYQIKGQKVHVTPTSLPYFSLTKVKRFTHNDVAICAAKSKVNISRIFRYNGKTIGQIEGSIYQVIMDDVLTRIPKDYEGDYIVTQRFKNGEKSYEIGQELKIAPAQNGYGFRIMIDEENSQEMDTGALGVNPKQSLMKKPQDGSYIIKNSVQGSQGSHFVPNAGYHLEVKAFKLTKDRSDYYIKAASNLDDAEHGEILTVGHVEDNGEPTLYIEPQPKEKNVEPEPQNVQVDNKDPASNGEANVVVEPEPKITQNLVANTNTIEQIEAELTKERKLKEDLIKQFALEEAFSKFQMNKIDL